MKFTDCFIIDQHKHNKIPKWWLQRILRLYYRQRYSMPVLLRLTEYFFQKYKITGTKIYLKFANYFKRKNETFRQHAKSRDMKNHQRPSPTERWYGRTSECEK